jgi:hypothetical protein
MKIYGPLPDEATADALRTSLERPVENGRETIVEHWPLVTPPGSVSAEAELEHKHGGGNMRDLI